MQMTGKNTLGEKYGPKTEFLFSSRDLSTLSSSPADVLELVDEACSSFLPDLALCASLYRYPLLIYLILLSER